MSDLIVYLNESDFDHKVAKGITLVDFYADWCGPCRMLTPVLEQVAKAVHGKVTIAKVDIDDNQRIATQFQVTSVPTMVLLKDGKEINRLIGLRDAEGVKKFIATAY
jgi:thioredoxin 1